MEKFYSFTDVTNAQTICFTDFYKLLKFVEEYTNHDPEWEYGKDWFVNVHTKMDYDTADEYLKEPTSEEQEELIEFTQLVFMNWENVVGY